MSETQRGQRRIWIAHKDGEVSIFSSELAALQHAVQHGMRVLHAEYGRPVHEQIAKTTAESGQVVERVAFAPDSASDWITSAPMTAETAYINTHKAAPAEEER